MCFCYCFYVTMLILRLSLNLDPKTSQELTPCAFSGILASSGGVPARFSRWRPHGKVGCPFFSALGCGFGTWDQPLVFASGDNHQYNRGHYH